jgi:predicted RNase H-like HicB family nuclease
LKWDNGFMLKDFKLTIRASSELRGDHWATKSDPFAITVYGATQEEAEERLIEAIKWFLVVLSERGRLEGYLTLHQIPFVPVDPSAKPTPLNSARDLVVSL